MISIESLIGNNIIEFDLNLILVLQIPRGQLTNLPICLQNLLKPMILKVRALNLRAIKHNLHIVAICELDLLRWCIVELLETIQESLLARD